MLCNIAWTVLYAYGTVPYEYGTLHAAIAQPLQCMYSSMHVWDTTRCVTKGIGSNYIHTWIRPMSYIYDITLWLPLLATNKSANQAIASCTDSI